MREPKSMSPVAIETSSYLLLTFFSAVFFSAPLKLWQLPVFFMHLGFFLPLQPVLAVKFPSITRFHSPLPHSQG